MREIRKKRFTQIDIDLYGDAMLVSLKGLKYCRWKPTETSVFEFFFKCVISSLEELIKIKVIFILRQRMFK